MIKSAKSSPNVSVAFAPANISCIFTVQFHDNPRWMGSTGLGFTMDKGVTAEVIKSNKTRIYFNKKKVRFPTVITVLETLTNQPIEVNISSELPLGSGFGLSGASALAAAYATNKLLALKKTKKELAIIAHTAEVMNKTGLGDVVNQYYGGFFLKQKPSSYFEVVKIPITNMPVYWWSYGKLMTKSVLANKILEKQINIQASLSLKKIQIMIKKKNYSFEDIIAVSKEFSKKSGLLKNKKVIEKINTIEKKGGIASMILLGNGVFSSSQFPGSNILVISDKPAHLL